RLREELIAQVAVVDGNMKATFERLRDSMKPQPGIDADVRDLPFVKRQVGGNARLSLDFAPILSDENLFRFTLAAHEAVNRQCIKEFVGEDTSRELRWQLVDPFHIEIRKQELLMRPHRSATFQNFVAESTICQDVAREHSLAGAQFDNSEI